jgi:chemotaxis protein MotB
MARKKKHPEHVNHERWLVSYADFVTLLFAFFVVMFAVSQVDGAKVGRFTESFSKAEGIEIFPNSGRGVLPGSTQGTPGLTESESPTSALPDELSGLKSEIQEAAKQDSSLHNVQVLVKRNELVLRLPDSVLFDSGEDALREPALKVLQSISSELRKRDVDVRVEGHTDDRPIHNSRFDSNWNLSTRRATSVVAKLAADGIPGKRLSAAGYGEFRPVGSNATEKGKQQNRRVDLVVSVPLKEAPARPAKGDEEKPKEGAKEADEKAKEGAKEADEKAKEGAKDRPADEKAKEAGKDRPADEKAKEAAKEHPVDEKAKEAPKGHAPEEKPKAAHKEEKAP